ncbi:large conductance mechanosensitive channel protein MscL [Candidatus Saccharibacteria bacterium]|nr:large conductance mechanosensitive channel protein MscL [Candidatus Saccharibacteria bacterium]
MVSEKKSKISLAKHKVTKSHAVITGVGGAQLKGFLEFIRTQGVIGLAVGLVLGGAVSVMVKSLVDNVVMPPIGLLLGSTEGIKGLSWTMGLTSAGKPAVLHYGIFLNDLFNFLIIALVVYALVSLLKVDKLDKPKDK